MSLRQHRGAAVARRALVWLAGPALAAALLAATAPGSAQAAPGTPPTAASTVTDPAAYVDPFIGTGSGGGQVGSVEEYPGPDAPFGMIQWGPETGPTGSLVGYNYDDTSITGFSLTRLGGVGCNIFQDFNFLPTTDAVTTSPGTSSGWKSYTSGFSHSNETAQAAYYKVTTANGITTQLTTGTRAALGEFSYPAGSQQVMLINAANSTGNEGSTLQIVSPDTITGSSTGGGFCGHTTQRYTVYFSVTFSQPFASSGTWQGSTTTPGGTSVSGDSTGGWVSFGTSTGTTIEAKVAISYVSVAGAQSNAATISDNFQAVRAQTYRQWNSILSKIDVSSGTAAEETTFYTNLYQSLLDPSTYSDADGQYMGFDFKVHTVPAGHTIYANFSGWDIYRSEIPLLALLAPGRVSDMVQSLVDDAEQGGWLPKWPTANVYTGMMGGDSADPIIADAYAFGARDFDTASALQYMLKGADDITSPAGQGVYVPRTDYIGEADWGDYLSQGYVNTDGSTAFGTSLTEEFALDDFTIGQFAAALGDSATATAFAARGQNWENVFDPGVGEVVPRGPDAPASTDASRTGASATQTDGFEEGDAAQYTWMIPQNLSGLFAALGGDKAAASDLNTYFSQLNAGSNAPYDWQGNEVVLNDAYEYDYLGEPWQTQNVVREVLTQLYGPTPGGSPGNNDLGAMNSWYVWGALGLYPETVGTSTLALGSPLFPHAVIHEGDGHTITINAPGATAATPYVHDLTLNGHTDNRNYLTSAQYADGATLDYTLSATPDTTRGTARQDDPPSYTAGEAPAIGYTTPFNDTPVARGVATTVQVGAQSIVSTPQAVTWTATASDGITVTPSSGTIDLKPGQRATAPMAIEGVGLTLPEGQYPVSISFTEGGKQIGTADLYLEVGTAQTVTDNQPEVDLAAGGLTQATYTITNNTGATQDMTFTDSSPSGVTDTVSPTSAAIPAGATSTVAVTFTSPASGAPSGTGESTFTATDAAGVAGTGTTELNYTNDLALNAYEAPYPAASATSSQAAYPVWLAVDGNTSTYWVSGGPSPTPSTPIDFDENFGEPVTIGSVTVDPRSGWGPTAYSIETSDNGTTWTTDATVTVPTGDPDVTTTLSSPVTAQYLQLVMTGTFQGSGDTVQVAEVIVTAPQGG
jgi:predicted alpha-1,2-mannosidase